MSWQSDVLSRLEPKLQAVQAIDGFHWSILAQSADTDTGSCGTATTKFEAATKALAELVERISISDSSRFRLEYATAEELDEPDWFQWPSPNGRLDSSLDSARMYWIEGCDLETGRQRFLPAHSVFIRWDRSEPWEFRPPIPVGAAVHSDKQLALENARDELLEHHTKMLYFFAGRLGEEFKISGDHHLHDSYEALQRLNVVPYFYRMSIPRGIDIYVSYLESQEYPGWLTLARTYLRECAYTFPHPFH